MEGKVKPVNVAPLIKCARYSFLILGYLYGTARLASLRAYEKTAREVRHKMLHERAVRQQIKDKETAINDFIDIAHQIGVTEFTPGWEKDI